MPTPGPDGAATIPDAVADLSPRAKAVYLYLTQAGPAPPAELAAALGMKRLEVFPALDRLAERGLLERPSDGPVRLREPS